MGHDIYGYKDKEHRQEVAYLRRGAGNELARDIYRALDATEHDCGCSGCGNDAQYFTEAKLREALTKLPDDESHEPERRFLLDCIEKGGGAWVGFW